MGVKKRKLIFLAVAAFLGTTITFFGGGKLLLYFLLLLTGAVIGYNLKSVIQVIKDYRLSLKINTVLFNSKETNELKEKVKQLQADLQAAETRMKLKEHAE